MGVPAASGMSSVVGIDIHVVMVPTPGGPVPTPLPHPFSAPRIDGGLVQSVTIAGQPAAVQGSTATNSPAHVPTPPGTSFQSPPADEASVMVGSATVLIGGKPAARLGDATRNCNDPADAPTGQVVAAGTVLIA